MLWLEPEALAQIRITGDKPQLLQDVKTRAKLSPVCFRIEVVQKYELAWSAARLKIAQPVINIEKRGNVRREARRNARSISKLKCHEIFGFEIWISGNVNAHRGDLGVGVETCRRAHGSRNRSPYKFIRADGP